MSKQSPRPLVERADAGFGRYVRPGIASVGPADMTSRSADGAGKLNQHSVSGRLNDPAPMGGDRWVNKGLSDGL